MRLTGFGWFWVVPCLSSIIMTMMSTNIAITFITFTKTFVTITKI